MAYVAKRQGCLAISPNQVCREFDRFQVCDSHDSCHGVWRSLQFRRQRDLGCDVDHVGIPCVHANDAGPHSDGWKLLQDAADGRRPLPVMARSPQVVDCWIHDGSGYYHVQGIVALQEFSLSRCDTYGKIGFVCSVDLECLGGFCRVRRYSRINYVLSTQHCVVVLQSGLQRCKKNFLTPCTNNAQCPRGDTCLFHLPTFQALEDQLLYYVDVGLPNITQLVCIGGLV